MKKTLGSIIIALTILLLSISSYSCVSNRYLKTESAKAEEITGSYNLILYGRKSVDDIKSLAILSREGSPYTFEIFAPAFDYRIIKGLPAEEAFERAEQFVSYHPDFWKAQFRKIIDDSGNTIGYEVRPLFNAINTGNPNLLNVNYKKTGNKVIVYIKVSRQLEYMPFEEGGQLIIIK